MRVTGNGLGIKKTFDAAKEIGSLGHGGGVQTVVFVSTCEHGSARYNFSVKCARHPGHAEDRHQHSVEVFVPVTF